MPSELRGPGVPAGRPAENVPLRRLLLPSEMPGLTNLPAEHRVLFEAKLGEINRIHLAIANVEAGNPLKPDLVEHLPRHLEQLCVCQRGLRKIDVELCKPWGSQDEAELVAGLKDVHRTRPELGAKVKRQLGDFAEKQGQQKLAEKLRNIVLEKGPAAPEGPGPADFLPIPEAEPAGGHGGQQEAPFKGLDDLGEDVSSEAKNVERQLNWELERWADVRATWIYDGWQSYVRQKKEDERHNVAPKPVRNRSEFLNTVQNGLGRKLRPSEPLLIANMFARSYTPERVIAELQGDDEEGRR
jgi:hypothetical protein